MKIIGYILLILPFIFSTGESVKCYECHAHNAENCHGKEIECPEGSRCMTVSEKFGCNHTYYSVMKRCSMNLACNTSMYAYVNNDVYYELSYYCCNGDLCNSGGISLPNKTYEFNGPECPACSAFDTLEKCTPVTTTVCRNATDNCAYLTGRVRKPGYITQYPYAQWEIE
ncbi:CD59 glycoprotein-like [Pyxicephalus adspersus]|uniref:CD59 glycoprotein-like n=1 Tax=Pyxicephalus adspersus TaxID=30357 RepID=UPI003B58F767